MNPSDLAKAQTLLAELDRRREQRNLELYCPSRVQAAMHDSPAHVRLMVAANGTGKTTSAVAEAVAFAKGYRPWNGKATPFLPPVRVLIALNDFTHSAESDVLPIVHKFLPVTEYGKPPGRLANGKEHLFTLRNGSEIHIMSYEQATRAFEGAPWHLVVMNEPPPRHIWVAVKRGLAKREGYAVFAMTPVGADAMWVHSELFVRSTQDPDIAAFTATIDDAFMTEDAKRRFMQGLTPAELAARVYGQFSNSVGRVYLDFSNDVNVLRGAELDRLPSLVADPTVPKGLVVDPHDRRPFAMAWFLITPQNDVIWFKEWPKSVFQEIRSTKMSVADYADLIKEEERGIPGIAWRLLDPNYGRKAVGVTQQSFEEKFHEHGFFFETRIRDSLHEGHDAVRDYLVYDAKQPVAAGNRPTLYIAPECQNLIASMNFYSWVDTSTTDSLACKEKVSEEYKDFADLVRYMAISQLRYFNPSVRARHSWARNKHRGTL